MLASNGNMTNMTVTQASAAHELKSWGCSQVSVASGVSWPPWQPWRSYLFGPRCGRRGSLKQVRSLWDAWPLADVMKWE